MDSDGFPRTGLGSWRQYRRRLNNAEVTQVVGVQCHACVNEPNACRACWQVMRDWSNLHFGGGGWMHGNLGDGERAAAAR